ncbi:preprotein translocase subunit SecG [Brachybacterium endophyticum]|uniref:Protein-export membrane protein SecG n=1 Tax=Brachybacterium endophyticum TaxID=2182385 RepID=A0A2U2RJ02_9MICO|nr:preprotein translocase subunit SecG [Brachybacterium endophyticum]PWH05764.1 preprotein translocase subunit SecG [Brachybacterium endophyticum]
MDLNLLKIILQIVLGITGVLVILLVLLHRGKGGGLSDMFGGGVSSSASASGVAERNLDRLTVTLGIVFGAAAVGLGVIERFM